MAARILVADDSVTIQKVVELTFSKEDFVLVPARSGEEAIRKAKEERPDLVLLDLVMPDKNGYQVCAALRAEPTLRAVPIILLTGTFEAFDQGKGIQAGANDFITKPFESQVLVSKVKQLLFAKTVSIAPAAAPMGPGKVAPLKEAPRPAPTIAAPPAPAIPPRPSPAPAPPRGVAPGVMRGVVPPSPAPTPMPPRAAAVPPRPPVPPAPVPAAPASAAPIPSRAVPRRPAPTTAAAPPARPVPMELAPPSPTVTPRAGRTIDLSPPSEEISQDRVRRLVEPPGTPPPPAPGGVGELSLDDLTTLPLPEAPGRPGDLHLELEKAASGLAPIPDELLLGMPPLAPEPVQKEKAAPPPEAGGTAALPESLSLEELLSAEPTAAPLTTEPTPTAPEELPGGPVFDLTSEMGGPPLPLVEVGTGEPPALSIEDLLASTETALPPPVDVGALELPVPGPETPPEELPGGPVFELTGPQEAPSPPLLEVGAGEPPALSVEDLLTQAETAPPGEAEAVGVPELELELTSIPQEEAAPAGQEVPSLDLEALVEVPLTDHERIDLEAALTEEKRAVAAPVVPPSVPAMEAEAVVVEVQAAAVAPPEIAAAPPLVPAMEPPPPVAAAMRPPGGAEVLLPEVAAMRQDVTERVAHELARDLSDKLLERIERIVWEVVPDLAEILITKEIERIRALSEGKQSS